MIYFYLSEMINGLKHSKFSSLVTLFTLYISVIITSGIIFLFFYSQKIETKLKEQVVIRLFLEDGLKGSDINNLRNKIRKNEFVKRVRYISRDDAAEKLKKDTGEDFIAILGSNPLPASFNVQLAGTKIKKGNLDSIVSSITSLSGIEDFEYDYSLSMKIIEFINKGKNVFYGAAFLFLMFAVYMVYTTNRLVIEAKLVEYNNMKLVGATIRSIKMPLYFQGVFLGIIAALLAWASLYAGFSYFGKLHLLGRVSFMGIRNIIIPFFLTLGIIYGVIGGYFATRKINYNINLNQ